MMGCVACFDLTSSGYMVVSAQALRSICSFSLCTKLTPFQSVEQQETYLSQAKVYQNASSPVDIVEEIPLAR